MTTKKNIARKTSPKRRTTKREEPANKLNEVSGAIKTYTNAIVKVKGELTKALKKLGILK